MDKLSINKYPSYKDSGVEWLGQVPEHWGVTRNKDLFEERGLLTSTGTEILLTVSHITGVTRRSEKNVNMFMAETMAGYKVCKKGDLIINTMWAWMGALGTSSEGGICSPAYGVYKPKVPLIYNYKYFDNLYRTGRSITEMTRNSKGIVSSRLRLYPRDFFRIYTAVPPLEEQKQIADYLDRKTELIDKKISLLDKKAEHYKELKQSLINETVTRGIIDNGQSARIATQSVAGGLTEDNDKLSTSRSKSSVKLKDSGIDWIGKIPEHWAIRRLKDVALANPSNVDKKTVAGQKSVRLCNYVDVYKNDFITEKIPFMVATASDANINKFRLKIGDVVITKDSEGAEDIAEAALVKCEADDLVCGYHLNIIRTKKELLLGQFLFRLFDVVIWHDQFKVAAKGITRVGLGASNIRDAILPIPPIEEQQQIADYLDEKIAKIDSIIASIGKQTDKLKEFRKTLINDVVTGKIKVVESFKEETA